MKVLLVGNYPGDRQESMRRYADLLLEQLQVRGYDVILLVPPVVLGRLVPSSSPMQKWLGYIDKFLLFRGALKRAAAAADIVHICDHSNSMYVPVVRHMPHLITCHDILAIRSALGHFPENSVSISGRLFQRLIAHALMRASTIVCISGKTRDDLVEYLNIAPERLEVVHSSLHWPYAPVAPRRTAAVLEDLGIPVGRPFFLHVGAHWYKNRFAVLRIFAALRDEPGLGQALLVMTAGPRTPEFQRFVEEHGLASQVRTVDNPTNAQLQALYSGAHAFIFPSRAEGFGWPILEAQACGCPVAVPDQPPMNVIAGNAAILIDPENPHQAAAAIARALANRSAIRQAGFENLTRFTPEGMTSAYMDLYERAVADHCSQVLEKP
jgi:glycosyltransferase involved in cell wall biosynthesis